jgi:hypothetical protein
MRTFIIAILLFCAAASNAQFIPNHDFEHWTETQNDTLPSEWGNSYFGVGRTPNAYHGNYAVTIWNWYSYSKGRIALGGKDITEYDLIRSGIPFTLNGDGIFRLRGYYRYVLGQNGGQGTYDDSAMVFVLLRRSNNATGIPDTAGYAVTKLGPANDYTPFEIRIHYRNSADTLALLFYSSERGFCHSQSDGNCLYLTIDSLTWSYTPVGSVHNEKVKSSLITPNPFSDIISFGLREKETHIIITNSAGIRVHDQRFEQGEEALINGNEFPEGVYFYRIISGRELEQGKLIKK